MKHRYWDDEHKVMIYNFIMNSEGYAYIDDGMGKVPDPDCLPMMCTEKKDKKDELIWEGDTVKYSIFSFGDNGQEIDKPLCEVKYSKDSAMFFLEDEKSNIFPLYGIYNPDFIEVVGHKYVKP